MKLAVVGAGAMGSILGGSLAHAGHEVWLTDPWTDHVEAIRRHGLRLLGASEPVVARPHATSNVGEVGSCDLVLVMVKAYHTAAAAESLAPLIGPTTLVLTLQNGLGNVETLACHVGRERVLPGVTYRGGEVIGPGEVRQTGIDKLTIIGEPEGPAGDRIHALAAALQAAGIRTMVSDNIQGEIWGKLLVNVAGNALGAILGLPLGYLLEVDGSKQMVELVLQESSAVARAIGVNLPYDDPLERVRANWSTLQDAKSSLHQDIERGRRTEIEALNGAVAREGERLGVPVPYNRAVTLLVTALEARSTLGLA
jgi:2-dehydropantoate 2-reductase